MMRKVQGLVLLIAALCVAGCDTSPDAERPDDAAAVRAAVASGDGLRGAGSRHWDSLSDRELWEHVAALDSTVDVGLKLPSQSRGVDERGLSLVPKPLWSTLTDVLESLGLPILTSGDLHPIVRTRVSSEADIKRLRESIVVEFVEPGSFSRDSFSLMSGCGSASIQQYGNTVTPGDRMPYTAVKHRVNEAWVRTAGEGVTIGVVDTGISQYQSQLMSRWDSGQSAGRSITRAYTDNSGVAGYPWSDTCGHGTKVLGLIGAPRDGLSIVGFAYRANAYATRAVDDPVALVGIWDEVRTGIDDAAFNAPIVNMSFGSPFSNTGVQNVITYHYYNRDILFFGAAGSGNNYDEVVFPASMTEVVAVTGLTPTSSYPNYIHCDNCYYNTKVEFSAWVDAETLGIADGTTDGVGKSSAAAASISAIAALIKSEYSYFTRSQILERLRSASPLTVKNNGTGYGPPDAMCAVGGVCGASVSGPYQVVRGQTATFTANHHTLGNTSLRGRFTYSWNTGATTKTMTTPNVCGPVGSTGNATVTIRDTEDNTTYTRTLSYQIVSSLDGGTSNMDIPGCGGGA